MSRELDIAISEGKQIFFLYGPESYLLEKYIDKIMTSFLPAERDWNLEVITELPKDWTDFKNKCDTLPFMSEYRVLHLKETKVFEAEEAELLIETIENLSASTILIISEKMVDKRKKLWKAVQTYGKTLECNFLSDRELGEWIGKWFYRFGIRIRSTALELLLQRTGGNLHKIVSESEKLLAYVGGEKIIEPDMIKTLVQEPLELKIFDLTDAIADKQTDRVVALYRQMIENRESPNAILYMVAKQCRQIFQMKSLISKGSSQAEIVSYLAVHPFVVKKLWSKTEKFSFAELAKLQKELMEIEWGFKSGKKALELELELFLYSIA